MRLLSSRADSSFSSVKLFLTESDCSSIKDAVDMGKCPLKPLLTVQFFFSMGPRFTNNVYKLDVT